MRGRPERSGRPRDLLESLEVESFDTCSPAAKKGTVYGEQCTCGGLSSAAATSPVTCDDATCGESCDGTCPGQGFTCLESCGGTCWNPRCQDTNLCN